MKTRRKFTSEFKAKVAIESIKEWHSLSELAQKYNLHPNQINQWKREFLSKASTVFESKAVGNSSKAEKEKQRLYETIGHQKVEIDFLKKALS